MTVLLHAQTSSWTIECRDVEGQVLRAGLLEASQCATGKTTNLLWLVQGSPTPASFLASLLVCSRNALLSPESRHTALCLNQSLKWAEAAVSHQDVTATQQIAAEVRRRLTSCGAKVDYVEVRHQKTIEHVRKIMQCIREYLPRWGCIMRCGPQGQLAG